MNYLLLAVLSAGPSVWVLYTSLTTLVHAPGTSLATRLLSLLSCVVVLRLNASLIKRHLFARRARRLGCEDAFAVPHRDPILGLDAFLTAIRALKQFKLPEYYTSSFERYGQTYYTNTLGRWILLTNEAENIKTILGTNMADWPIDGPRLFSVLPVLGPRSIFTTNGQQWHEARAMMRPSFVRDQVADLKCFGKHIDNLLAVVPRDGSTFDIQDLILKMTMDSSTDFMMGHSTNSLVRASPEAQQFYEDFEYASAESAVRGRLGPMLYYLPHRKLKNSVKRLRQFIRFYLRDVMEKHGKMESKDRSYVFIDELLKMSPPEEYLVDQVLSVIVAGRDTTAAGLSSVFYCLARHPDEVERLRDEIQRVGVENPTWEQLKQMKFLNNVIREALRLFPPISTNSRTSSKETMLPLGGGPDGSKPLLVPKGTAVRWSLYSLHRRRDIYGPDADEFRPQRWESDLRVGWEYLPFSGGPRICIGQQFALTQMALTLYKFFRTFKGIEARESGDPLLRVSITLSFAHGCLVGVKTK